MSQYDWGTMDGSKSGIALATDLNSWRTAVNTSHRGVTEPTYKVVGTRWVDSSLPNDRIKIWDGIQWLIEVEIDVTNNLTIYGNGARIGVPNTATGPGTVPGQMWTTTEGMFSIGHATAPRIGGASEWEGISHNATTTAAASLIWTGMAYRGIRLKLECLPATDNVLLYLHFSTDNGATYDTLATHYEHYHMYQAVTTGSVSGGSIGVNTNIPLTPTPTGNAATETIVIDMEIWEMNQSRNTVVYGRVTGVDPTGVRYRSAMVGVYHNPVSTNAFRFSFSSGNIAHSWYLVEVIAA